MPRLGSIYDDLPVVSASPMKCAMCDEPLEHLSEPDRQTHYETHFADSPPPKSSPPTLAQKLGPSSIPSTSTTPSGWKSPNARLPLFHIPKTTSRFWTSSYALHAAPPSNYTPNFIPILRRALIRSHAKGTTTRASLCSPGVCHIATEGWDSTYGCGYRNYMMACTALYEQQVMPQYFALLEQDDGGSPGIRSAQELLECAWSEGYDVIGASQLKHKLVGTMKWIGAGEIYTAFTYRGIPTRLIDFPQLGSNPQALTRWVSDYFFPPTPAGSASVNSTLGGATPVIQTEKMPLILQHQGHSRTIVGIEINRVGAPNLLVFDPAKRMPAAIRKEALSSLPPLERPKQSPSNEKQASSSETKQENGKLAFGQLFSNKRPRFIDDDEDEEERDAKRGKHEGTSGSKPVVHAPRKPAVEEDYLSILKIVRVNLSNLKKKDKYQILEFTLEPPLSDGEKASRKVVRSEKILT